jgi:hypothetical protein
VKLKIAWEGIPEDDEAASLLPWMRVDIALDDGDR